MPSVMSDIFCTKILIYNKLVFFPHSSSFIPHSTFLSSDLPDTPFSFTASIEK